MDFHRRDVVPVSIALLLFISLRIPTALGFLSTVAIIGLLLLYRVM